MSSIFADILRRAVQRTPGALGGALAAADGELVDAVSSLDRQEWALMTAHYGVVLGHVQSALHTFHFGEAEQILSCHGRLDIVVQSVALGYYAILAVGRPGSVGTAMQQLAHASVALRQEIL